MDFAGAQNFSGAVAVELSLTDASTERDRYIRRAKGNRIKPFSLA